MKCKVCGKRFRLEADKKYIYTKHPQGFGVLVEEDKHYECFDCPRCGCQNIVNIREGGERDADT